MKNKIRAFIAVNLSPAVRSGITKLIQLLQTKIDGTKWVETENLHVTLKFLGDLPMTELHRLITAVQRATDQVEAFDLEFHGCGAFPTLEAPKTIWIGCDQGAEDLVRLASGIEDELFKLGYPKESRRFSPHLTIGRVKVAYSASNGEELMDFFGAQKLRPFGCSEIDEVILYSSELTRRGPVYEEIAAIPLNTK